MRASYNHDDEALRGHRSQSNEPLWHSEQNLREDLGREIGRRDEQDRDERLASLEWSE